jgi:competence protein ComEA
VVNINTASAAQLEELPGIGPVLAERVVAYREQNGPFQSVDELAEVAGISDRMVDELRALITTG